MKSIDFIILKMNELRSVFPFLNIVYDFNEETHILDINKNDLDFNHIYYDFEFKFIEDFYNSFPEEDLVFISNDEDKIFFPITNNPKLVLKGLDMETNKPNSDYLYNQNSLFDDIVQKGFNNFNKIDGIKTYFKEVLDKSNLGYEIRFPEIKNKHNTEENCLPLAA